LIKEKYRSHFKIRYQIGKKVFGSLSLNFGEGLAERPLNFYTGIELGFERIHSYSGRKNPS